MILKILHCEDLLVGPSAVPSNDNIADGPRFERFDNIASGEIQFERLRNSRNM